MLTSASYIELINRVYSRAQQDGARSYPVACYEVFMLAKAQEQARERELILFRQLGELFDWRISRRQQTEYASNLKTGSTLILTDLTKTILWTSQSFLGMTGNGGAESIGQTPKLLQGVDTDLVTVRHINDALRQAKPVSADMLNYRKNGDSYTCRLSIQPLYTSQHELTHFLAVEQEVTGVL